MTSTLSFSHPARCVYTAVKHVMQTTDEFRHVECDDVHFRIVAVASHGWSLIPTGQDIRIRVVATSSMETEVISESKEKVFLNLFAIPQNKENVNTLSDYIRNRVNMLCSDEEIKLRR